MRKVTQAKKEQMTGGVNMKNSMQLRGIINNLETVLAEKFETIISRGILDTRSRDFYDVFILTSLQERNINKAKKVG